MKRFIAVTLLRFKYYLFLVTLITLFLNGCRHSEPPPMTSLQIQAIQSRQFETSKVIAFTSTMSVLQDLGYKISQASIDTGFITAESPTSVKWDSVVATAFIQSMPNGDTKIRLNFVTHRQVAHRSGGILYKDTAIYEPKTYQDAFNKIQEQIFINTPFRTGSTPDTMQKPDMQSGTPAQ